MQYCCKGIFCKQGSPRPTVDALWDEISQKVWQEKGTKAFPGGVYLQRNSIFLIRVPELNADCYVSSLRANKTVGKSTNVPTDEEEGGSGIPYLSE